MIVSLEAFGTNAYNRYAMCLAGNNNEKGHGSILHFLSPFTYCIFMERYDYIYSCLNTYAYLFLNTFGVYIMYIISYLPNPSARVGYDTRSVFKRSLAGLNSEFSFS